MISKSEEDAEIRKNIPKLEAIRGSLQFLHPPARQKRPEVRAMIDGTGEAAQLASFFTLIAKVKLFIRARTTSCSSRNSKTCYTKRNPSFRTSLTFRTEIRPYNAHAHVVDRPNRPLVVLLLAASPPAPDAESENGWWRVYFTSPGAPAPGRTIPRPTPHSSGLSTTPRKAFTVRFTTSPTKPSPRGSWTPAPRRRRPYRDERDNANKAPLRSLARAEYRWVTDGGPGSCTTSSR
jgi:hypothetical protein